MQENKYITIEGPEQKNMISRCSCTDCDSIACFTKRQAEQLCNCETCRSSTSCLFHNINLEDTKLCSEDIKDLAIEFAVENLAREIIKKQIIYELTTSNNEQTIKKQSKLTYKITNPNESESLEPENAATTSYKEESLPKANRSDGVLHKQDNDPKKYKTISAKNSKIRNCKVNVEAANNFIKQASSSHAKLKAKVAEMQYKNSQKDKIDGFRESESKYESTNRVAAPNVFKETCPSIARISAEVMNLQYKNSQKTIAKPSDISNIISIINKIKEAYKACSCKVCECIVGKPLDNELCKCKPCECSDCASFNNKHAKSISERLFPTSGDECSCAVCIKSSCRGIGIRKRGQACDCTGVLKNSNLYGSASFRQPCDCEPCQCIECRTRFTSTQRLVVAPVIDEYQNRSACDCSPCECGECVPAMYGLSSIPHNEMSTGVNRHPQCRCEMCADDFCVPDGNQSCRCERRSRVMSKPFQQTSRDYDIRRTNVSFCNGRHKNNRDTIAMYAAVMKSYPDQTDNLNKCGYNQCECKSTTKNNAFSKRSASAINNCANNAFKLFDPELSSSLENKEYDCKSCKHHANTTHFSELLNINNDVGDNVCNCKSRNSLVCPIAQTYRETKKSSKYAAKGIRQCECADCKKLMSTDIGNKSTCLNNKTENYVKITYSDEFVYPVKRGELLTPEIFKRKINDALIETANTVTNDKIAKQLGILKSSLRKPSTIKSCYKPTFRDNDIDSISQKNSFQDTRVDNLMFLPSYFLQTETLKHPKQSKNCYAKYIPNKNKLLDLSLNSSISLLKESESSPSKHSYRDYPSYLVHSPKTVETCLNDVMRLDTANNIDLISMNTSSGVNVQRPTKPAPFEERNQRNKSDETHTQSDTRFTQNYASNLYSPYTLPKNCDSDIKSNKFEYRFDNLGLNEDYARIQNTLKESRVFSSQLLQLLEKYDKANREFESVSKKFRTPNFIIQNVITIEENMNALGVDDIPTKDLKSFPAKESVEVNKNTKEIIVQSINTCQRFENDIGETVSEMYLGSDCKDTNEGRDESGDDISRIDKMYLKTLEEKEFIEESYQNHDKTKNDQNKYKRSYTRSIICSKKINGTTSSISGEKLDATESKNNSVQQNNIPNEADKQTIFERCNISTEDVHETFHNVVTDLKRHVEKSNTDIRVPGNEDLVIIKEPNVERRKEMVDLIGDPWPILNKNFYISNKSSSRSKIMINPSLEKHIKTAEKIIAKQPIDGNATYMYKNKALTTYCRTVLNLSSTMSTNPKFPLTVKCNPFPMISQIKLYSEVKKLVDLPTLQTFECIASVKKALKHDIVLNSLSKASFSQTVQDISDKYSTTQDKAAISPSISTNSCDAFKVSFLSVRQVSHHTIVVKWRAPRALDNVEGYELLVDGRAVKKILCPSRCMAVVTCLHSGKVLLTVRTVMTAPCLNHCPAATVIYQPRVK